MAEAGSLGSPDKRAVLGLTPKQGVDATLTTGEEK